MENNKPNEREKIVLNAGDLNEFQFQCTECKSVFRIKVVGGKIIVSCGCGSTQGVEAELAELTAPAGGDVGRLLEEFCGVVLDAPTWDRLCEKVQAALTTARKDAEARVEALEAENEQLLLAKGNLIRGGQWLLRELGNVNKAAIESFRALLDEGAAKPEEAEREGGAGRDALEEVE